MSKLLTYLPYISFAVGAIMALSGILHDVFVLTSPHGKKCDRDLLRLLMDGHVLITCGAIQMVAFMGLRSGQPWAYYIVGIACLSLLIYCAMIFPFLKSIGTIFVNLVLLLLVFAKLI